MWILTAAIFTQNDSRGSETRTRQYAERALFAQRLVTWPVTLRQSGSVLDHVIEHVNVFLSERRLAKAELPSPPHSTAVAPLCSPPEGPRWTSPVHKSGF